MEMVQQQKVAYGQTLTCLLAGWLARMFVQFPTPFPFFSIISTSKLSHIRRRRQTRAMHYSKGRTEYCVFFSLLSTLVLFLDEMTRHMYGSNTTVVVK